MQEQLTRNEASEYLAMARQITALPNSLNLRQVRRFRNLAVRHAAANPGEPMAQLWADHATIVCAEQLVAPPRAITPAPVPPVAAPPAIDLRQSTPPPAPASAPIDLREPAPVPAGAAPSMSPSYSDEVLLAAILHNNH